MDVDKALQDFQLLEAAAVGPQVLAIGECGLDRICATSMPLQVHWFRRQLSLAEQLRKPIIIHCVRTYDEVHHILKEEQVTVPVVFHGFRKGVDLAHRILDAGSMLSFGWHPSQLPVGEVFCAMPIVRIFLETDDTAADIDAVYASAASLRGLRLEDLAASAWATALSVFGEILTIYG